MATAKSKEAPPVKLTAAQLRVENQELKEKLDKFNSYGYCYMCDTHKSRDKFYVSTDPRAKSGITPICKECARKLALSVGDDGVEQEPTKESVQLALRYLDKPFLSSVWDASVQESENLLLGKTKSNVWTSYVKNIAMGQYNTMTYADSDHLKFDTAPKRTRKKKEPSEEELLIEHSGQDTYDTFLQNKKDVIRLLDYDPFEDEALSDQPILYAQLLGMIDAGGEQNDDMMRVSSCITIVRGFLQQSKIDNTIARLMANVNTIEKNSATIKSLQESKAKINTIIKDLAAESCISLKNNKNAKKGENTWTGKIKKIKDIDLRQGRVNGFDIETSKAMRQVMDMSNKSILQELKLDESDWSDMVAEQRDTIVNLQNKLESYIEISRILLSENLDLKDFINNKGIDTEGYNFVNLEEIYSSFASDYDDGGDVS